MNEFIDFAAPRILETFRINALAAIASVTDGIAVNADGDSVGSSEEILCTVGELKTILVFDKCVIELDGVKLYLGVNVGNLLVPTRCFIVVGKVCSEYGYSSNWTAGDCDALLWSKVLFNIHSYVAMYEPQRLSEVSEWAELALSKLLP